MLKIQKFSLPEVEEKVLAFWKDKKIFEKSVEKNEKNKPFVFFEGPPTANGRPGIHHVLARAFKDIILRYKTMRGFYVPRRGGWDTHGLPVELEVEKQLGFTSKKDIEAFGIEPFNEKCRESVWKYKDEWEKLTMRMGFWLDLKHPYVTYKNAYMETLWWILKEAYKKKLLYKGHKIVPWCPRCGTALSSHEIALGYKEVEDKSVFIKFRLKRGQKIGESFTTDDHTHILSWTTTPWTLPGNVALAVGKNIKYVAVKYGDDTFILAESRLSVLDTTHEIKASFSGRDLIGASYESLFDISFFKNERTAYRVYGANFVTTEDGTGVVHTAVMYGEDDYNLGMEVGLPAVHTVTEAGEFVEEVPYFAGMKVKDPKTERLLIAKLDELGLLFKEEAYKHEYPFCWRCSSALLYYARSSWFIRMSSLRKKLISENKKINWIPDHLKDGRFGAWIRETKDWAISRERFWGTPLPIWECGSCGNIKVVGDTKDFENALGASSNTYIVMRHGEAENITRHLINSWPEKEILPLTEKGISQVKESAKALKKEKIDVIFASDITRTKQTAEIVADIVGVKNIHFDPRIREFDFGDFNGTNYDEYAKYYGSRVEKFTKRTPNGENHTDLRKRAYEFLADIEAKYKNKKILIVTHDGVVYMLHSIISGWSLDSQIEEKEKRGYDYVRPAGFEKDVMKNIPRDRTGSRDLHRPFIDTIKFKCNKCGKDMSRVPEVADVWFDSGSMPLAQMHYPFSKRRIEYPADYISEGIDQTRGWFYTLLAVAVILGKKAPYKNVISLGLVLDKDGQKMSKSKGNTVSPWDIIEKYGVDAARWYLYTINPPGEPKRFDEVELAKIPRQIFSLLYNSFSFFDLYADKSFSGSVPKKTSISSVLDKWILSRLTETSAEVTKKLDLYDVGGAARYIEDFVNDLSRWYIRRSRKRLQRPETDEDYKTCSGVLGFALIETAKLMAPFAPFFADALYVSLPHRKESVHLEDWTTVVKKAPDVLIAKMDEVRKIASIALAERATKSIKVRQPLKSVTIKSSSTKLTFEDHELIELLKDEINVKDVIFSDNAKEDVALDTEITNELKEEGIFRELLRAVQDLRQDAGLKMRDTISLFVDGSENIKFIVANREKQFAKDVNARSVSASKTQKFDAEIQTKIDDFDVWIGIQK